MVVAERSLGGFNAEIELDLEFSPDVYVVRITDPVGVIEWRPQTRREATDMFFHPFAYGYTYSVDNIDLDD
jgi:hypothetical protein